MTTDSRTPTRKIALSGLKSGMTVTAYTGFESRYSPLDEQTCEWVKLNFSGAFASAVRDGTEFRDTVSALQPGDHIHEISDFPASLKNICSVNDRLIAELKKRGFTSFEIELPPDQADAVSREEQVARAVAMIAHVKESLDLCDHATSAVESLMDVARDSDPDFSQVKDYVAKLSSNNTTVQAVSAIVSLKENDHVYAHCVDVGVIFQQVYYSILEKREDAESAFKDEQEAMLGAFLHDIGKARVSRDVINDTRLFEPDGPEIREIRKHPELGAQLLEEAGMPAVIANMAHYHHIKLDDSNTSSYPKGVAQSDIMLETRLLAIIDMYQALVSGRSYKKSWTPSAVIRYMDAIAGIEFELDLWNDFQQVMGYYPISTVVQLSDGSLGFVINVPKEDLLNPQVAIVQEADGSRPSDNRLVNLAVEENLSIKKDLGVMEVFKENAFEVFSNLNIV